MNTFIIFTFLFINNFYIPFHFNIVGYFVQIHDIYFACISSFVSGFG